MIEHGVPQNLAADSADHHIPLQYVARYCHESVNLPCWTKPYACVGSEMGLVGWLVNRPKWDRPGHGTGPHVMGMVVCKVTQAAGRPDICPSRSTNGPTTFEHPEAPFEDMCVASKMLFFDKMLFMFPQL